MVTLNDEEWAARDEAFRTSVINAGPLGMAECPAFYQALDGVVFPSLLECFSVTPLESMAMGKPLFASDRKFVRDVCKEFAFYFDPVDEKSIASAIASYFLNRQDYVDRLAKAESYARSFSTARIRAQKYLEIIRSYI
ncbi:MAG: glycosyltransferase [Betaproteobacteria bacterium]|nr:glycosyltransferase [Betaproteobacteria bacterium]